jgi:hypothetical protein
VTRPSMRFVRSLENRAALCVTRRGRCWSLSERNC